MPYEKYIISVEEKTLAMKYNLVRKELTIGGLARFSTVVVALLSEYFQVEIPSPVMVQKNKLKFTASCSYKKFREGIILMKEHSFLIQETTNLGNIMR